jgi:hypothetical protein
MLDEVVDDGELPGTGGLSWGGSNRRRASAAAYGSEASIERRWWLMSTVEWLRRSREKRGVLRCEEIEEWRPLFIMAEVAMGAAAKSTWARLLRRAIGLGEGGALLSTSWRSSGWQQLG